MGANTAGVAWHATEHLQSADAAAGVVDLVELDRIAIDAAPALDLVARKSALRELKALGITDPVVISDAVEDVATWSRQRAAELVGKRWGSNGLQDHPDAQWSIRETTRDGIRRALVQALEDEEEGVLGDSTIERNIRSAYEFSRKRAKLIARTELDRAANAGAISAWKRSGGKVTGKVWVMADTHLAPDVCDIADAMGVVDLKSNFGLAGLYPPAHPGCKCRLQSVNMEDDRVDIDYLDEA